MNISEEEAILAINFHNLYINHKLYHFSSCVLCRHLSNEDIVGIQDWDIWEMDFYKRWIICSKETLKYMSFNQAIMYVERIQRTTVNMCSSSGRL